MIITRTPTSTKTVYALLALLLQIQHAQVVTIMVPATIVLYNITTIPLHLNAMANATYKLIVTIAHPRQIASFVIAQI